MDKKLKKILPMMAMIGALIGLAALVALSTVQRGILIDTGETTLSVVQTLSRIQAMQPQSIEDPSFKAAIDQAREAPYIATIWLFSPEGQIIQGNAAYPYGVVDKEATEETRRILAALPEEFLTSEQSTALQAASVMQAEGEHNDVYRHILREVYDKDGKIVALAGATFDVSPEVGDSPSTGWILLILGVLLGMGIYWIALPFWVWLDARDRGERYWVWGTFVLLGNLVALMAYILARAPRAHIVPEVR
jgi:hypothetical protein